MKTILAGARSFAPYLLIELLMPGGTLLALLLWLKERRRDRVRKALQNIAGGHRGERSDPSTELRTGCAMPGIPEIATACCASR